VDDTAGRAHQHVAGARKRVGKEGAKRALERARRSVSVKPEWAVYQGTSNLRWRKGRPLTVLLTPGQRHGSTRLGALLDAIRIPCARRNVLARCVNRLTPWRGVATRYEKRAAN
jgi:hypothetical protein